VSVNIEMDKELVVSDITISPTIVDFTPDVNTKYFTITVGENFNIDELSIK